MKILLLDNAIDSFEWSLRHLRTFLQMDCHFEHPDTSTTYLKQAIICLNSALELFFKERISVINPLLIYEHISTDALPQVIVDYYAKEKIGKINEPLYNYVIENIELHTIDYSKCIDLYCTFYSVAQGHKENFIELNSMRNQLTHLGINSEEEYYILAESIWRIANENRIEKICNYIISLSQSKEIQDYMEEKKVIADFGPTFDAEYVYSIFTMEHNNNDIEICSIYASVKNNALFISDSDNNDGPVFAIIPLGELDSKQSKFYITLDEDGTDVQEFQAQSSFWKNKPYSSHFAPVPYGKNKIIEMLKKIINYMSIIQFKPYDE